MSDFDFGFTFATEEELDAVQEAQQEASNQYDTVGELQEKVDKLYNMIMPLLNNLAANPDKDIIRWEGKDRLAKIEQFRDKLDEVYKS